MSIDFGQCISDREVRGGVGWGHACMRATQGEERARRGMAVYIYNHNPPHQVVLVWQYPEL
jgi:hypothetical protein